MNSRRALLILVAVLAACDSRQPLTPPPDPGRSVSDVSARPFYFHQGEPVYVHPAYDRVVVASDPDDPAPATTVREIIARFDLSVASTEPLRQVAGHHAFRLTGGLQNAPAAVEALRADPRIDFAAPAYTLEEGEDTLLLVNELTIHFRDGVSQASIESFVAATGTRIVRWPQPLYGWDEYRLAYPRGADPLVVAAAIYDDPLVEWADPNKIGTVSPRLASPTDPYYPLQYYFKNSGNAGIDINIEPAWDITLGEGVPSAGGITVAVIDDGVEADHPDFGTQVEANYAFDAVIGTDHSVAAEPQCKSDSHGTNVAGIILGQHDNAEGIAGGAPGVHMIPIRIYSDCAGVASDADAANAIAWAWYWTNSDVISNSWKWHHVSDAITNEIKEAVAQGRSGLGTTVVFAAGNDSRRSIGDYQGMTYPGYLSEVIGVGAIDRDGNPADYTPRDSRMDIVALSGPRGNSSVCGTDGGDIVTTELTGAQRGCDNGPDSDPDYTSHFTGTSAAAPQVAAAAALLYSANGALSEPGVRSMLLDNANYWGRSDDFGAGKLNVGEAIRVKVSLQGPAEVYSNKTCTWKANASGGRSPYTYAWYRDGVLVDSDDTYTGDSGSSDFFLEVIVTDRESTTARDALGVTVIQEPFAVTCEPA